MEMTSDKTPVASLAHSWFNTGLKGLGVAELIVLSVAIPVVVFRFVAIPVSHSVLPFFVLIPLLLGLRYGFFYGVSAAILVAGVLAGVVFFEPKIVSEFPKNQAILWFICGALAGQFRDYWATHYRRIAASSTYHQTRLAQFTHSYHLLELSHAQLERQVAGSTTSLRSLLQRLKAMSQTMEIDANLPLGGIAPWMLDILVGSGNLHGAAIYAVNENNALSPAPIAMVGDAAVLNPNEPMLQEVLSTGEVTSVHANNSGMDSIIAIVPIVDSRQRIHGVLSINAMPFISIHQRTFDILGILARHMGDILDSRVGSLSNRQSVQALSKHLEQAMTHAGLPVAVVATKIIGEGQSERIVQLCLNVNRGLDESWLCHDRDGNPVIIKILPMSDEAGAYTQLLRFEQQVVELYGIAIAKELIRSHVWKAGEFSHAKNLLKTLFEATGIENPGQDS